PTDARGPRLHASQPLKRREIHSRSPFLPLRRLLEEAFLTAGAAAGTGGGGFAEGLVGLAVGDAPPGRPAQVALLDEEGLDDVFEGVAGLGQGGRQSVDADGTAVVV